MTLRDQLDQIARLEEKARQGDAIAALDFLQALKDWFQSGGRELAEAAIALVPHLERLEIGDAADIAAGEDAIRRLIQAARAREEK